MRLVHVRLQVEPRLRAAVDADVVGVERAHHVGRLTGPDRGDDLLVDDATHDVECHVGVRLVVLGRHLLEGDELLPRAPADPDAELRRGRPVPAARDTGRGECGERNQCGCNGHAFHPKSSSVV